MFRFVLDCSVTMSFLLPGQATTYAHKLFTSHQNWEALVPSLWELEVSNVLARQEQRGRLGKPECDNLLELLAGFNIHQEQAEPGQIFKRVLPLTRQLKLTSYDATYLELAIRHRIPIATLDAHLSEAATLHGAKILVL